MKLKKKKNRGKGGTRLVALALTGLLGVSLCGCENPLTKMATGDAVDQAGPPADAEKNYEGSNTRGDAVTKEETVFVMDDAGGARHSVIASEWLKNGTGEESIEDASVLSDIENTAGDETFEQTGDQLTWTADGKDIKYRGNFEGTLPVDVELSYYMDGDKVSPSELSGRSGDFEIHFDYTVRRRDGDLIHPFAMVSCVLFDNENFHDLEVTRGKTVATGDRTVCTGIAFPGMKENLNLTDMKIDIPESVIIRGTTDDFSIDGTYTVALSGMTGDMDLSGIDDVEDMIDQLENGAGELSAASKKLVSGSGTLATGAKKLDSGTSSLVTGIGKLQAGSKTLTSGTRELKKGTKTLTTGSKKLLSGTGDLKDGAGELADGTQALADGLSGLVQGTGSLADGTGKLKQGTKSLYDGASDLSEGTATAKSGAGELTEGLSELATQGDTLEAASKQIESQIFATVTDQINAATEAMGVTVPDLDRSNYRQVLDPLAEQIKPASAELYAAIKGAEATLDNIVAYTDGVTAYTSGVDSAYAGSQNLSAGLEALNTGAATLTGGTKTLYDSVKDLDEGASQLSGGAGTLKSGADSLNTGADKLATGAGTVNDGVRGLYGGTQKLYAGTGSLYSGADKLETGIGTLSGGAGTLDSGMAELYAGAKKLARGMNTFDRTGIQALVGKLNDAQLSELMERMDAIAEASREPVFVGGRKAGMDGSSKIIFKTDEI